MPTMTPVGATSRWIAAARALETESEEPLFVDPFARDLAGDVGFSIFSTTAGVSGASARARSPYLSIRTKFLDDSILQAVRARGYTQVVILAAGMDTRAFRLDWPAGLTLFEVDRGDVFEWKEPVLERLHASPTCDRRVVRADLTDDWTGALTSAGFSPSRPAAFLLEGLLMYLREQDVERLLASLSAIATQGSWFAGDVINDHMLTSGFTASMLKALERLGCPWQFGMAHPESYVARFGWTATVVLPGDPAAQYGPRFAYPAVPRSVPNMPRMFLVTGTNDTDAATAMSAAGVEVILKRFEQPDDVRAMTKGIFEIVRLGGLAIGRATYEPGWKWSEHVGAALGKTRCTVEHVGMVVSGSATAAFDDGRVIELRAGELFHIPAVPHDSWVVGDEPYVSIHFLGADHYAK
jgi:methyltransferase (TIGR00027 family)